MKKTRSHTPKGAARTIYARMLHIHERLKSGRFPNCSQMGEQLGVTYKTVQRDIDYMRDQLRMPIEFDAQHKGFYYSQPVIGLPCMQVSEGELVSFFMAEKVLQQYQGTPYAQFIKGALQKLTAGLKDKVSFSFSDLDSTISFHTIGTTVADLDLFEIVSTAVLRSRELEFEYKKPDAARFESRRVQPYHVGSVENMWYLFAFDLAREQMRTFALSRMRNARVTDQKFQRPSDFSMSDHLSGSFGVFKGGKQREIRIWFDSWAAQLIRERHWHPSQKIQEKGNGEIELTLKLGSYPEIIRWVMSWGVHAKVLAPTDLQAEIRKIIDDVRSRYA